jgi:hypothetical protein
MYKYFKLWFKKTRKVAIAMSPGDATKPTCTRSFGSDKRGRVKWVDIDFSVKISSGIGQGNKETRKERENK